MLNELDQKIIDETTKWETIKQILKEDPRYKAIGSKTEREKLFADYVSNILEERKAKEILSQKRDFPEGSAVIEEQKPHRDRKTEEAILLEVLKDHVKQTNLGWFDAEKLIEKDKRYIELEQIKGTMPYIYKDYMKNLK